MSDGADGELQKAAVAALSASTALRALIGNPVRLYQDVPDGPTFPYVTIGESQTLPDRAECIEGFEIFLTLDIWTRQNGIDFSPNKKIGAAIYSALHNADLTLTDFRCLEMLHDTTRYFVDADNRTVHGVTTFVAKVEPTV